ncbi:GntR family transcriptional regulator [Streptomyces sp. NA02950]|uniref:GntR family transcriptional regulator n=1 Tax=Streptomyces sp. NA02950 TaxID=2742137 RepID=UPI0020CAD270|nr:GntR family transcriptional regulator [Streptomyces sp. NA02950]
MTANEAGAGRRPWPRLPYGWRPDEDNEVAAPPPYLAAGTIADRLRDPITSGALAPGSPLRDAALAEEFGVSRNAVREAVRLLVHEGLAVHQLYKGAAVKSLDVADVHDIYAARRALELRAAEQSFTAPQQALDGLDRHVSAAERAAEAGRWSRNRHPRPAGRPAGPFDPP